MTPLYPTTKGLALTPRQAIANVVLGLCVVILVAGPESVATRIALAGLVVVTATAASWAAVVGRRPQEGAHPAA